MDSATDLLARLRALEDERSILRTLYKYGHGMDYDLAAVYEDCWCEGAVVIWGDREPFVGRPAIMEAFEKHLHAPAFYYKHLVLSPVIDIDGDEAAVSSYYLRLDKTDDQPVLYSFGKYEDRLVRCDDGVWRFRARRAIAEAVLTSDKTPI